MTIEELGRKQTPATKAKISKALQGKNNPAWKGGVHQDYYRRITGAKKGEIVHHKDGNRKNGAKSNLQVIKKEDRGKHDKVHNRAANFQKKGASGTHNKMKSKSGVSSSRKKKK